MKIFFFKKSFINSKFIAKSFNVILCILVVTLVSSQILSFSKNKLVEVASQNAQSYFTGIVLSLGGGADKNVKILVNGSEYAGFETAKVSLPIAADSVIEVYNPKKNPVKISISEVSGNVSLLANETTVNCQKGITYICRAFCE